MESKSHNTVFVTLIIFAMVLSPMVTSCEAARLTHRGSFRFRFNFFRRGRYVLLVCVVHLRHRANVALAVLLLLLWRHRHEKL
ncbi:hypothetical protein RHGRI_035343 [Rhododendron griersonianum]|uniref:Secreted protein n=1 Tax=Rhododendron griersonianum TaxID=479676 RepID=A0AAV6I4N3_9ERIC|nr:hypothetical protein RHGRI_035343 [Rhododendron griersonianum]